jgi:hypothetical protein
MVYRAPMTSPFEKERADALDALETQTPQRAFAIFRPALEYPGKLRGREDFVEALGVLARIAQPIVGELVAYIDRAAESPDDPGGLYDLGYQLIEQGLEGIAATVLARALSFAPGEEQYVNELCAALEGSGRSHEACNVLRAAPGLVEGSFLCRYLLSFNSIVSGDLATASGLAPGLDELADPSDEDHQFMRSTVARMLARARVVRGVARLDESDLRGWHFVVTGGLLTHLSPFGFDEGMSGRYAFTQDSPARCVEGIRRLQATLRARRIAPSRILYLPDRGSEILGRAAGHVLDLPVAQWPADGDDRPALIVAYDLAEADIEAQIALRERREGQILFVHAADWRKPPTFAPDVVTLLAQINQAPWSGRFGGEPVTGKMQTSPADTRPAEVIALEIAAATLEDGALDDLPTLVALAEKTAPQGPDAALLFSIRRETFWQSSPVKSSYFT